MNKIHLLCNAHIDPVWQWEWEEGAAAAISTFRVAARFCEEYEGFVFNHNEAILYKWVEEYEPALFEKIRKLVREGRWHIIGGWYLQPDCNMPSGESFVRQILYGKRYFKEKFDAEPATAVNFDSFGHTRGLVQIMKKAGYDSYVFLRPDSGQLPLPAEDFVWVGFDGSRLQGHRLYESYNTLLGKARDKVENWIRENGNKPVGLVAWGVGNHGGGPSRIDLDSLKDMMEEDTGVEILHSTPEKYFYDLKAGNTAAPAEYDKSLNPMNIGCYTSQIRIKQKHRLLENEAYMVEKMLSSAALQGCLDYPASELHEALCDLMTSEFHDILPGSSVQSVEETSLRLIDHGLEIISRLKARAFFALSAGQEAARDGEIPILVYNPHPFKVKGVFECEFMLEDQNWKEEFSMPVVYRDGRIIPSQPEKENSNLNLDWRKRVVFSAELEPSQMNRFDCRIKVLPQKPQPSLKEEKGKITFRTEEMEAVINCETGLLDQYKVHGVDFLKQGAFLPLVMEDDDDPWGMRVEGFRDAAGEFKLMSREEGTDFSGIKDRLLDSVRVIEDGAVRSVVEAVFNYGKSFLCILYKLPKRGTEFQVQLRVSWNEKSKMLKLSVPTTLDKAIYMGQAAYGVEQLAGDGTETVSQKWAAVVSEASGLAFTCINEGTYGSDFKGGEMRISLLRSPGYCGHPILDRPILAQDRFSPRIDQGERLYNFYFNGGKAEERLNAADREATVHNEKPYALSFFPSGEGQKPACLIELSDQVVQLAAFKKAEGSEDYVIRLFSPSEAVRETVVGIPFLNIKQKVRFGSFELKTLRLDVKQGIFVETDLMERPVQG